MGGNGNTYIMTGGNGMQSWELEGMGSKESFPHISNINTG